MAVDRESVQRIRLDGAVVQLRILVVLEQIVARNHVLHAGAVQLGYEAQPDGQLVGAEVVLYARFHAWRLGKRVRWARGWEYVVIEIGIHLNCVVYFVHTFYIDLRSGC